MNCFPSGGIEQIDPPDNVSAFFNNVVDDVAFRLQFDGRQPPAGTVLVDSTYGFVQLRFTIKGNFSLQLVAMDGKIWGRGFA